MTLTLMCATLAWCANGDRFTADIAGGGQLKFEVISEEEKTCMVYQYAVAKTPDDGAIVVPETVNGYTVVRLYYKAFYQGSYEDSKITSITLPGTIREINDEAFYRTRITKITIPEGVTALGGSAFCGCAALESVSLPSTLVSPVGYATFMGCTSLKSVDLPDGITEINHQAFWGCINLKSVHLPNSLTKIWRNAFYNCSSLERLELPEGFVSIEASALSGCSSLTHVTIPSTATDIEWGTFWPEKLPALKTAKINTPTVIRYFYECKTLESVELGPSVRVIDREAFRGCTGLKSINLHESLTSIGYEAFYACSSLESVELPHSSVIHSSAFGACNSLRQAIVHQDTLKAWFSRLESLETVVLGDEVKFVESGTWSSDGVFYNCTSLKNVTLSANITKIADGMFYGCTSLTDFTLSEKVDSIGKEAFYKTGLATVTLPAQVKYIGSSAFSGCNSLRRIHSQIAKPFAVEYSTFPWNNAVLIVPQGTKADYKSVSGWKDGVIFEDGETVYDKTCIDAQGVKYTLNQNSTDYSTDYSVTGHTDGLLEEITIPNKISDCKVKSVNYNAFTDCTNLKKVTFSEGLTNISFNAFNGCIVLKEYVSLIKDPSKTSVYVPDEIYKRAHLIVPTGTKESYLKANSWHYFYIFEEGETVMNYERYPIDEQGLTYRIGQNANTFYYSVTGHGDDLPERVVIPETLNGLPVTEASNYELFKDCVNLKYVSIPKTMKTPYYGWYRFFSGCKQLTLAINQPKVRVAYGGNYDDYLYVVELGEAVDTLEYEAFSGCKNLSRVSFPERMDTIADKAFSGCVSLTSISLPKGIKNLGNEIFQGCTALTTISFNEVLTSIGSNAFSGCTALTTISLNEGLTSIGSSAFSGCTSLHDITLPESLTDLGSKAFYGCTSLETIIVPKNIVMPTYVSTGNSPFTGCTGLNTITIHAATFGSWFSNFTNIKNVYIGSEVTAYSNGLTGCTGVEVIEVDAANKVFDSRDGCNALINTATNELLRGCNTTKIPETVISIAMNAFTGSGLTEITIPAGVTSIGNQAFSNCARLLHVTSFIKNPYYISAFDSSTLTSATLTIPFGRKMFYQNASGWGFQTINEMEGNEEEKTFIEFADANTKQICLNQWDTNKDGEISIEEAKQVTAIGRFSYYSGYKNMKTFDELKYFTNVTTVDEGAFSSCDSLTSITLPAGMITIGNSAFQNCKSLKSIVLPNGVTSIGNRAFYGCESLLSVNIPKGVTTIGEYVFYGCKTLSSMTFPDGVTAIGQYAFKDCKSLVDIMLPDGLNTIGTYAFNGTSLVEMTIPSAVTSIGDYALAGNIIHCLLTTPISVGTLMQNASDVVLYVPQGCEQAFSEANGWKQFLIVGAGYENVDWADGQVVVDVDNPGGLRLALIELDDEEILRLKIRGILNSTDLVYLIEGKGKIANMESLDLSDVTLDYDGGCYKSSSFDGISDTGFEGRYTYYYLTEEETQRSSDVMGISPKYYFYYYGPNLAGAFEGLPYKHVVMPRKIKKAAHNVFANCKNLQSVEYPGGLSNICDNAFAGCVRLQKISLSETDSIGQSAFQGCSTLADVGSMEHVEYLAESAFENCKRLRGGNGILSLAQVDSIPNYAFKGCISLGNILLSDKLYHVGQNAFSGCKTLKSISLPASLTMIDDEAFANCDMLQTVQCTEVPQHVNYTSFYNTPWMKALPVESGVKYWDAVALSYDSSGTETPTSLSFREGTTAIADRFIGSISYSNRNSITKLTLPLSLLSIGAGAFSNNNLTALTLPEKLKNIGIRAFSSSSQLTKVTLPEGLEMFGSSAFENSPQLTIVNYNAIAARGEEQFANCESIEKVNVGAAVQLLPDGLFKQSKNLTVVKFADRIDGTPLAVGNNTFEGCTKLTTINLPTSTRAIGNYAFSGCASLKSFAIPENVTVVSGGMLSNCSGLTSITLHEGITTIGDNAFWCCSQIPSFTLPESLDSIGKYAFGSCYALTELTIPAGVTRLGNSFVESCYQLTRLVSKMHEPMEVKDIIPMSNQIVEEVYGHYYNWSAYNDIHYDNVTLIVPDGCKPRYKRTADWNKFKNIEEESGKDFSATNKLYVGGNTVVSGGTTQLTVSLMNDATDLTAYQFDLIVPLGFKIATDVNGKYEVVKGNRYEDTSHSLSVEKLSDHQYTAVNKYRFVCLSANNSLITGTDGMLLTINLRASANYEPGDYEATLDNIIVSKTDGTKCDMDYVPFNIAVTQGSTLSGGDVNGDNSVDVSDAVATINVVLQGSTDPDIIAQYDVNGDGDVDVMDVTKIVVIILANNSSNAPRRAAMNRLALEDVQITLECDGFLVDVERPEQYTAFQFDVEVPEGLSVTDVMLGDGKTKHNLHFAKKGLNTYTVVGLSLANELLPSTAKGLVDIRLSGTQGGDVIVKNIMFVNPKGEKTYFNNKSVLVGTTGIYGVSTRQISHSIYDLSGRKLDVDRSQLERGIYIINGKKVIIK